MSFAQSLFLANCACSLYMTGLIFFVQIVHYPLFERVGTENFAMYAEAHARRTSFVTAPVMLLELAVSLLLIQFRPFFVPPQAAWLLAGLTSLLFASTFFIQMPLHRKLASAYSGEAVRRLVASNWLRVGFWSLRSLILLSLLSRGAIGV